MSRETAQGIRFGRSICGDLEQAERREWWLSNGRGAYAAGTIAGSLTRRYHGLLIAPTAPPLGRSLLLAKVEATVTDDERVWPLATNRWADGIVEPQGHRYIESFQMVGRMPVWQFALDGNLLEQRIWMEPGVDVTYVAYRLVATEPGLDRPLQLKLRLLVNGRDHHGNTEPNGWRARIEAQGARLKVTHPDGFALHVRASAGQVEPEQTWIERFQLAREAERGLPDLDSHLRAGQVVLELEPGQWQGVAAGLSDELSTDLDDAMQRFLLQQRELLRSARTARPELRAAPPWIDRLVLAADSFLFSRPLPDGSPGQSVIAGYPWFGDWGRDTLIALPGLTLATGRAPDSRRILQAYAHFLDHGMLPNVFPVRGETPQYNSADAALWYVHAWHAYLDMHYDREALGQVFPLLADIVHAYREGTRYGIGIDAQDGLLRAGTDGVQVTWMDARVGDRVVTPRIGKPVEINALWFNAVTNIGDFAERLGHDASAYRSLAARIRQGFQRYVRADGAGLMDVLDGPDGDEARMRPNQILAVSLPHSPLEDRDQAAVVQACAHRLLCSYGLRSLDPSDPDYRGVYTGGVAERDSTYHNGPAWAWLLGHYALAEYRVSGDAAAAQRRLAPLADHLLDAGLGTISEIFDGDPPHAPRGAPAQAWSVACTLEAWGRLERARTHAQHAGQDEAAADTAPGRTA